MRQHDGKTLSLIRLRGRGTASAVGGAFFVHFALKLLALGSGIPNILNVWAKENLGIPKYEKIMDYSRAKLTLPIEYASDKSKTSDKIGLILDFIKKGKKYKTAEIANVIGLSPARARVYLKELADNGKLKSEGINKSKVYYLPDD